MIIIIMIIVIKKIKAKTHSSGVNNNKNNK